MASSHSTSAYDHLIKILLVGDAGTNKRELLARYIGNEDLSDNTTLGELVCVCVCVCCLLYTSPSPRDATLSRMPSSA